MSCTSNMSAPLAAPSIGARRNEVCDKSWRILISALPRTANSGPALGDVRVEVEFAAVHHDERDERGHRLGGGEDIGDRVLGPWHGAGLVSQPPHRSTTISPSLAPVLDTGAV